MKQIEIKTKRMINNIKFLPFNRVYKVRQDLINKMNKYGFTVPILLIETDLITGVKETFIVDGQHRFVTAQFLGITTYAELLDIKFNTIEEIVKFVASLNVTHKSWSTEDYVNSYMYLGYKEYITLNKITKNSPFSVTTISSMLHGIRTRGTVTNLVKEGKFVCKYEKEVLQTLNYIAKLSKHGKLTARMALALHYVFHLKNFNEEAFTKKYIKEYKCIKELRLDDYTELFSSWMS